VAEVEKIASGRRTAVSLNPSEASGAAEYTVIPVLPARGMPRQAAILLVSSSASQRRKTINSDRYLRNFGNAAVFLRGSGGSQSPHDP
jgi:hypothetical protein